MQKVQSFLNSAVLVSGLSHIFCCGLPLVFSIFSVSVGLGVTSTLPAGLSAFHEMLHDWERPMLIFSGAVLFLGWSLHLISEYLDCRKTGCVHEPCGAKKKSSSKILILATALFCLNAFVLLFVHA